jgi:two-component system sensor kinase FixL
MAEGLSDVSAELRVAADRIEAFLDRLERLAGGDTQIVLPISPLHDELDAIAHGINVVGGELRWAHNRMIETERAKANEAAIKLSDANFVTAFRSNPCAMTVTRLSDTRFVEVNESFERQTGFQRHEVIGRTVQEFGFWINPEDMAALAASMRAGKIGSREVRFRTKHGTMVTDVFSIDIVMFGGERCVLAVGLDITDRKNAEVQADKLREELAHLGRITTLDALAGSLAHEINQPLTAVTANAEAALHLLANKHPELAELRGILKDILTDNRRAGAVLQRVRTLLKKGSSEFESIDVNGVIGEVVTLVQANAQSRRIALDVELASSLEPVRGDRIQIQQVALNLLMNAFDAVQDCETGDRSVRLQTSQRDLAAVIDVVDRGHGLADDALRNIFEPFYTTKREGMGLGLSICRGIVTAHGGTLDAKRNSTRGMTFSARFPLLRLFQPD